MNMTNVATSAWESKRTAETRKVEEVLRNAGLKWVDAYRYNSASIRVRVIDERFEGMSREKRDEMVEPHLATLPDSTQADIVTLLTFAPSEVQPGAQALKASLLNLEFEDPSPSML